MKLLIISYSLYLLIMNHASEINTLFTFSLHTWLLLLLRPFCLRQVSAYEQFLQLLVSVINGGVGEEGAQGVRGK